MTTKRGRGRPTIPKATAGDAESIIKKVEYEFDRFDARLANELPELLDAYFKLALNAEKENTKKAVMEKLIERAEKKIEKDAIYIAQSEEDQKEKPEAKATGTTGQVYSLIQTNFEEK